MNPWVTLLGGAGLGVGAMYYLDPSLGAQRRAHARDQVRRVPRALQDSAAVTARDLKNRTAGFISEARGRLTEGAVQDDVLSGRVRSKLGFLVRHPSSIQVDAHDGLVTLRGSVLADEIEQLVRGMHAVRGVKEVDNQLEVHDNPGSVPALQSEKRKPEGQRLDIMQRHWSPATRFLVGTAGLLLMYNVSRQAHRRSATDAVEQEVGAGWRY
jgi:hypothetical protein